MRKNLGTTFLVFVMLFSVLLPFIFLEETVKADNIGVGLSPSNNSVEVGAGFSISVNTSAPLVVENYAIDITFDPAIVTYTGFADLAGAATVDDNPASGRVRVVAFGITNNTSSLVKFNFTAAAAGSASFSIAYAEVSTQEPPAGASTSVTITPPRSGNADLASLSVDQGQLSPAFKPGTQNYSIQVGMGVDRVVVSAKAADSKAQSVQVSGNTGLKDGANPIRVVVTAENGSTKTYTITANRLGPTPTPEPTPTPPMSVEVDDKPFYVIDLPEDVEVPAGFYEAAIEINGQMVTAYKSRQGGLVLLYLSNEGPESGFYFYDAQTGEFYRFAQLTVPGATYTRIMPDESVVVPDGFAEARITIDGEAFDCWKPYNENGEETSEAGIYLLYLLNDKGEKGFYLFQNSTRLIFPFSAVPSEPEPTPLPSPTPIPTPTPVPVVETNYSQTRNPYFVVTIILASIIVLLSGVLTWLLIRRRSGRNYPGPFNDGGGYDGSDDYNELHNESNFVKPPKIRRVGAPTVDDDFDE